MSREEFVESETVLPAGKYWVGDPCYAFEDDQVWSALLDDGGINLNPMPRIMECEAMGRSFVASGTYFGDGLYYDQHGYGYGVDAGLVGATPVVEGQKCPDGMREVEFSAPFTVAYDDGTITIGPLIIETDPEENTVCLRCDDEIDEGEEYCESCETHMETL